MDADARHLWRDPLSTPGDRFPLGPIDGTWAVAAEPPSTSGARPFSLRGAVQAPSTAAWGGRYVYDPVAQTAVAVGPDGAVVRLPRHTRPGATPSPGTSETTDGKDGEPPPAEEMHAPDYQED